MSLASITLLVKDKLRTQSLADYALDDVVQRAVDQALLAYGKDVPLQLSDVVVASGNSLALPQGWILGRSTLSTVEFPVGQVPMATLMAAVVALADDSVVIKLQADSLPADSVVRINFNAPHAADGSSIPAQHENAVACWAAAELCRQVATQMGHDRDATIQAVAVNGSSQSGDLARRAKDWAAQYRNELGLPDPDANPGGQPASAVVSMESDGHRRARFYSRW